MQYTAHTPQSYMALDVHSATEKICCPGSGQEAFASGYHNHAGICLALCGAFWWWDGTKAPHVSSHEAKTNMEGSWLFATGLLGGH